MLPSRLHFGSFLQLRCTGFQQRIPALEWIPKLTLTFFIASCISSSLVALLTQPYGFGIVISEGDWEEAYLNLCHSPERPGWRIPALLHPPAP